MIVVLLCFLGFALYDFGRRQGQFPLREKLLYLTMLVLGVAMVLPDAMGLEWPSFADVIERLPPLPVAVWGGM